MSGGRVVVRTEMLGGSPLARAAQAGSLGEWYRPVPRPQEWRAYADDVRRSVSTKWYDDILPAAQPGGAAADRLARSAGGAGIVVTSGQQPGLFGGPLYSLIKALSARALADRLEAATGVPAAPVFWAATDDADIREASVVWVALEGGERELRVRGLAPAGTPVSEVPMDAAELAACAAVLREACGSAAHAEHLEAAIACYQEQTTVGNAYVALLRRLLEPLGIAVLDASHPAVSEAGKPLLQGAARRAAEVAARLQERGAAITRAGFTPQVDEVPGLSLVFTREDGIKQRVPIDRAAAAANGPLSPTVLLRPVLERAILPTAAYLGGPGEIAYFAQVSAVSDALGVPTPLVLPRWSATIMEPRIARVLEALGVGANELADPHAPEGRVARREMPPEVEAALRALHDHVEDGVKALRAANDDLVPDAVVQGLRTSLEHRLGRVERRFLAAIKRREADAMRQLATARGALFPHGSRQERKLSYIPFLARYGQPLLDEMLAGASAHARALVAGAPAISATSPPAPASV